MRRVIVTGGTGAIGTALVNEFVRNNIEVLVLVSLESTRKTNVLIDPLVSILECGMDEYESMHNQTGKEYDVFYHFAWAGAAGQGRHDMYLQNANVKYALDAVGLAQRFGCKKFIGAGSQAEYGRSGELLKPETSTFPEMGYGFAKLCAGQMTREYAHQIGMEHIWVRVLSIFGPNDGMQSLIMSTIAKLKVGEVPKLTRGEQMWDYLYSTDAAEAFRLVGEKGQNGKIYVLGSGITRPLRDFIEELRDIVLLNGKLGFGEIPYTEKQVMYLCADISELSSDVNWVVKTTFKDGIREMIG